MLSRDALRPQFSDEQAQRYSSELYGIEGVASELPSERDQNFKITTSSGEIYVLKIAAESENVEILKLQNQAMARLQEQLKKGRSPAIVPSTSGREIESLKAPDGRKHFVRMFTYLEGRVLAEVNPHTDDVLTGLGRFVGGISKALDGWSHAAADRQFHWDIYQAEAVIQNHLGHISEQSERDLVEYYLGMFKDNILPKKDRLRSSILHNDANDHNVVVRSPHVSEECSFGILDFGDMVASSTVFEVAIAAAYTMLGKSDPLRAAARVIAGYHSVHSLQEEEFEVLFAAICTRLVMSVVLSAYQETLEPENEYLLVSQENAWKLLRDLRNTHPRLALYLFRDACGLEPCPASKDVIKWLLKNRRKAKPVLDSLRESEKCTHIDLSTGSPLIPNPDVLADDSKFLRIIRDTLTEAESEMGFGPYCEARLVYATDQYRHGDEYRTIHLGVDLFCPSGTPVFAAFNGVVHSTGDNGLPRDNGPTVVVEHRADNSGLMFYTLYAHLSSDSLKRVKAGDQVKAGQQIGEVGASDENGGWPPHLHLQLVVDMLGMEGDFIGVAPPSQLTTWQSISPDPNLVLGVPEDVTTPASLPREDTLRLRESY
ncbi:hypothetical protein EU524_01945, partial [Candidatus Thorarchaeota archaeon]